MFFILEAEMFEAVLFFIIFVSIDSLVFACIPEFAYKNDKLLYFLCSKEAFATFFSNCFVSFLCFSLCSINAYTSSGVFKPLSCQFVIILLKYSNVGFVL